MKPIGFHVMLRLADDRVIAPTAAARRLVARVMLRHGRRYRVVVFRVVDTHLHFIALCDARATGKLIRAITGALHVGLRLDVPFAPARRKPIADQHHLYAAFRYILSQEKHHGIDSDPLHDGSSLPELLGLRVIDDALGATVRAHLPRLQRAELLRLLSVDDLANAAALSEAVADAAAAAFALPDLASRTRATVSARRAAAHASHGLSSRALARHLAVTVRTVERLKRQRVVPSHRQAVELQLRLRGARAAHGEASSRDNVVRDMAVNPARS